MKKVAVFGNAGAGKSTLAKQLAEATGLPLHSIDQMKYRPGGEEVDHADYLTAHKKLLETSCWVIDGFGCVTSAWQRFEAADTLVYLDLPLSQMAWWILKRFIKGHFKTPQGWPAGSPIWRSTWTSYRVLWLCHQKLTPRYRAYVAEQAKVKKVCHLRSLEDIKNFKKNYQ
ncbi:adenylate kinase [Terasakiella pusilla]|uniref:adenylate kinase n=1 Tax=Terasakiella pusilla TaxID=64973 RepID=UPI003AA8B6F8